MRIAWIFPVHRKCGISFYAHEYVKALEGIGEVTVCDSDECLVDMRHSAGQCNDTDCIHIQYETSFFFKNKINRYKDLCRLLTKPLVVSLHEVYDEFPGVFPRSKITGRGLIRLCKEYLYDRRHPYQTAYTEHRKNGFYAQTLLVHSGDQKNILVAQGIAADSIVVLPLPVKVIKRSSDSPFMQGGTLSLASHGFLTPHYNYTLLFEVLESLPVLWRFTWIGGIRREEDSPLLDAINNDIAERNWTDKFKVTGWVSDEQCTSLLSQTDIYLALFSARSSSASLATALGAEKLIVATALPLMQELVQSASFMSVCPAESNTVIARIQELISDEQLRQRYMQEIKRYNETVSYGNMAKRLVAIYKDICT